MKKWSVVMILLIMVFLVSGCKDIKSQTVSLSSLVMSDKDIVDESNYANMTFIPVDNDRYFLIIRKGTDWADNLWYLKLHEDSIVEKKQITDVQGTIKKFELCDISQGIFLELYIASHQGNGQTILLNTSDLSTQYVFDATIDEYNEDYVDDSIVQKFKLPELPNYPKGYGYSFVYNGGTLTSVYSDLNKDGSTDVIFYGIKELIADNEKIPLKFIYIKNVYLYDNAKNKFILSQSLSEEKVLDNQ